jgi:protein O-mannosyl-transferase
MSRRKPRQPEVPTIQPSRRWIAFPAATLIAITIAAYWPLGQNGFLNYDDDVYVTGNWQVRQGLTGQSIAWAFGAERANNWHPLTWLSHMTDVQLFGMNARAHHLVSLGIHTASSLLLFGCLAYCTRRIWAAWLVAALFAVHPLHVESVAWIAERKDVLSALFWMAAMWMYAVYARYPSPGKYLCVVLLYALGLMSKPMLVTLPFVLLLLDYWPLGRFQFGPAFLQPKLRFKGPDITAAGLVFEKLPLFAMAAASAIMTIRAQHAAIAAMQSVGVIERVTNAVVSYGLYIFQTVWPVKLAVFYPHPRVVQLWLSIAILTALVAFAALVLRYGRSRRYLLASWFWYLITLLPVIGLVQVGDQAHADRYTYIPLIGLFVMAVWFAAELLAGSKSFQYASAFAIAAIVIVLAVLTNNYVRQWKNTETLCRHAISVIKNNYLMETNLALELFEQGKLDEAHALAVDSLTIRPDIPQTLSTMGLVMAAEKKYDLALRYYFAALARKPNQKELCFNIAAAYLSMNRPADALPYATKATELDPKWGRAFLQLSIVLNDMGRMPEAAAALARSRQLGQK